MNFKKWLLPLFGMFLVSMLIAACGGLSDTATFPTGKFTKPSGYGMVFYEDGTFTVINSSDSAIIHGTYRIDGDLFIEESNDGGCQSPVSFKYEYDGTNLNFQYVGDPADDLCDGRRADFNNQTYVLSK